MSVIKQYSKSGVLAMLQKRQGKRTAKEFAAELGVSAPYLSDIYAGKRDPGPAVLERLSLSLIPTYVIHRSCDQCGGRFIPRSSSSKFCSDPCRIKFWEANPERQEQKRRNARRYYQEKPRAK